MTWTIEQIERTFLTYMERHGHTIIEGHSVRSPTDDVLFTTAGMHPLCRTSRATWSIRRGGG